MKSITRKLHNIIKLIKGEAIILSVEDDKLIVDAGNKSAEELKTLASTFFKTAYNLQ